MYLEIKTSYRIDFVKFVFKSSYDKLYLPLVINNYTPITKE